jgi:hypothetical protein
MQLWRKLAVGVAVTLAGLVGCAEQVDDVDRVQPHYTKKSLLEGEWYFRQTIVDRPPQYIYPFTGIEGSLEKVRWEIREDLLIAYRTYEAVPGLDFDETAPGARFKGDPVAIYAIEEHFDIIRDFNRQTGEQGNVLVEDGSLRPWYEREYMRVNWAHNLVTDGSNLSDLVTAASVNNATTYWVREDEAFNPDHMQQDDDFIMFTSTYMVNDGGYACFIEYGSPVAGGLPCGAVEVKLRSAFSKIDPAEAAQFEPVSYDDRIKLRDPAESFTDRNGNGVYDAAEHFVDANGNGSYDSGEEYVDRDGDGSWSAAEPFTDANENGRWDDATPVKFVTLSVGPEKDTLVDVACTPEVLDAAGPDVTLADCRDLQFDLMGRFGFFRSERNRYDRLNGGNHDAQREWYANHHQMWKATKDDQGRTLPPSQRDLRPIVYYLNTNFPADLEQVTIKLGKDWDAAFMKAAMAATGRSADEIRNQLKRDFEQGAEPAAFLSDDYGPGYLFQIRRNNCSTEFIDGYIRRNPQMGEIVAEASEGQGPLPGNMERICAGLRYHSRQRTGVEPFTWQQMGDPRFSYVWWINEEEPNGPLGYGPSSADIENGHIISGNAYVYGAALDNYARGAADTIRALNGELDLEHIIDGRHYLDWLDGPTTVTSMDLEVTEDFQKEISRRIGSNRMEGYRSFEKAGGGIDKAAMKRHMRDRLRRPQQSDPLATAINGPVHEGRARLEALKQDPEFRARMVTDEMLQVVGPFFGWRPGEPVSDEMMDLAFEMTVDPGALRDARMERLKIAAEHNVYMADFLDDQIVGLALELKGLDPEEIYQRLRVEIFEAVMLHEIGHTVGLTHNFQASFDALNYQDDFWRIRTEVSQGEWKSQRLPEYRYASIMDYGSRFNSDTKGLGKYDYAAIQFVYGGHVDQFDDGVNVPGRLDIELEFNDYSKIPDMLGGDIANITKRVARPMQDLMAEKREGVLRNAELFAANPGRSGADFWIDRTVPFAYCADGFNGDLKCRTWDDGANHAEAVASAIDRYWNYFIFNAYRRNREEGAFINGFFSRQDRLSEYLAYPWKYYYFYDAYPVDVREDLLKAAMLGLNFINQVMGTPEPGRYCNANGMYYPSYFFSFGDQRSCESVSVPIGVGRNLYIDFSDDYVYRIDFIGLYYDKINFAGQLADTFTRFFRLTDDTDDRQYTIGYYLAFQDELLELSRDMMYSALGYVRPGSVFNNFVIDGNIRPQLLVDPRNFGGDRVADTTTPRIFSRVPYNLLWQSLALQTIYNTNSSDRHTDFVEYLMLNEKGSGDDRAVAEDADKVEFTHPFTGSTYVAVQSSDGKSLAYDLVVLANQIVEQDWEPAWAAYEADPSNEAARERFEDEDYALQNVVELMDDMRQLKSWVDYGQ